MQRGNVRQLAVFFLVPERFKIQEMCIKAVEVDPWQLGDVPYHLKLQEMCDKAVWEDRSSLKYGPDWFATREGLYMCHDGYYDDDGNYLVMINVLSDTMAIKSARPRKSKLKKS